MNSHPQLLRRDSSVLVVIDLQASLLPVIAGADALIHNASLLVRAANILGVPMLVTTQYAARLGATVAAITEVLSPETPIFDKLSFSAMGSEAFVGALEALGRRQVVVCGVETHICVSQTAQQLLGAGYQVHVPADAVSSRTVERHKLGMERLRDTGTLPAATEAVVYEWLGAAGTPEFKQLLPWLK